MSLDQMKVFNEYIMPATIETLAQMVDKFNQASNGAIRLTTEGFDGDFFQESFFAAVHSARRRVDRYAANSAASPTDLSQLQHNSVKVAGGFGPIRYEPGQMTWLQKPTAEGIEVASRNFAEAMLQDQLNTAILALVTATSVASDSRNDVTGASPDKTVTQRAINAAHAKFGDASGTLVAQVMSGAMYHRLIDKALTNDAHLFSSTNVNVVDILGKAIIVTDAPALTAYASPNYLDKVLSLAEGAATVFDGGDVIANVSTTNGKLRIETTMQVDYTFGLSIKGYTWDTATGGKSPTDADLATGGAWDRLATSVKHTAGVITIGRTA